MYFFLVKINLQNGEHVSSDASLVDLVECGESTSKATVIFQKKESKMKASLELLWVEWWLFSSFYILLHLSKFNKDSMKAT